MAGLRVSDARALTRAAQSLWEFEDLAGFRAGVLIELRRLVACDHAGYNEIGAHPDNVFVVADPAEPLELGSVYEAFKTFALQNPLAAHHARTRELRTLRLSDFVSLRELHSLDLYDTVYRPIGIEYQLAFNLPARSQIIGVTLSRKASDFSDRELTLVESIREIVLNVHRALYDRTRLEILARGLDDVTPGPLAMLLVEASGTMTPAHGRAEELLGELAREGGSLETLRSWARAQRDSHPRRAAEALTLDTEAGELRGHYLHGSQGCLDAIGLRPGGTRHAHAALEALGLTERQAEVLRLVWEGRSNGEIAATLEISGHTVRHHLEAVFGQLEVSSRAGAAHVAGRALSGGLPEAG